MKSAHRSVPFADAIVTHDVQDAHSNRVTIATAAGEAGQRHARELARQRAGACTSKLIGGYA